METESMKTIPMVLLLLCFFSLNHPISLFADSFTGANGDKLTIHSYYSSLRNYMD